ncbi:hypothetical protein [Ruania halotolerans]|uniref:hypothetical protein n=1 Tax=Ruania halotolerans TaxID=2897773 RepID=UPI001E4D578E|nr:hypothetical protein [Ruania halotolerans]UFU06457.1 hypothetical protein LQF10_18870 [Ruania halotolerans]
MRAGSRPRSLPLLAALVILAGLSSCASEPPAEAPIVQVEAQDWTGWQEEQPEPAPVQTVELSEGGTFQVPTVGGEVVFTVQSMTADRVRLRTDTELARGTDSGGTDLNDLDTRFELTPREPLELATPTMDGGTTITLTWR